MQTTTNRLNTVNTIIIIFAATLLLSFHTYITYFINSSFLDSFLTETQVGIIYILGAILNILAFLFIPKFLRRSGNFRLTVELTLLQIAVLLGIAFISWIPATIALFIVHLGLGAVIFYCLDIFLEKNTQSEMTGSIRGTYLTLINLAPIITPIIVGLILNAGIKYATIYAISAIFLIPFLLIVILNFRKFQDPIYPKIEFRETIQHFYRTNKIYDVFLDQALLYFFYCWMVIYMPIYLRDTIGFNWSEVGIILSIALLPFIIFQIPIGKIEDRKHDEKTILILGFLIISISVALLTFLTEKNLVMWAALLFISRIGASIVEISTETYFFKHVKPTNAGYIGIFRMTRGIPFLIVPIIATASIYLLGATYSWLILAVIMLLGVRYARKLN